MLLSILLDVEFKVKNYYDNQDNEMILSADNWGPVAKNLRFLCPLLVRWLQKTKPKK